MVVPGKVNMEGPGNHCLTHLGTDSIPKRFATSPMPIYTWKPLQSCKPYQSRYANLIFTQGKECLIEKFRNSSVMDQGKNTALVPNYTNPKDPAYRPKVFHSDGPKLGQEQEFPGPNNINRKLRSLVSVQRVGLFPPQESRPHGWQQQQH